MLKRDGSVSLDIFHAACDDERDSLNQALDYQLGRLRITRGDRAVSDFLRAVPERGDALMARFESFRSCSPRSTFDDFVDHILTSTKPCSKLEAIFSSRYQK
jgi:hypothetical protein